MIERINRPLAARLTVALAYTAGLVYAGLQVTTSPKVWGGTVCETTEFGHMCAGYMPLGLVVMLFIGIVLASVTVGGLERALSGTEVA